MGWIGVDLDGTLAKHYWPEDGPYNPLRIGEPIPAMVERVRQWLAQGIEVRVVTARVGPHQPTRFEEDIGPVYRAITRWTLEHVGSEMHATCMKDYAMIELWDDRCVRVITDTGQPCCPMATR